MLKFQIFLARDIGNEAGALNVNSQEAADVAHPT
jgi:hypothetical protein